MACSGFSQWLVVVLVYSERSNETNLDSLHCSQKCWLIDVKVQSEISSSIRYEHNSEFCFATRSNIDFHN